MTRAGRGPGKRGDGPRREGAPPPRLRPQLSPVRPPASSSFCTAVGSLSLAGTRRQQPLPREPTSLLTPPPRPCPQGVSLCTKNNPLLCLRVYRLIRLALPAPPPASPAARLLRPENASSQPSALRVSTPSLNVWASKDYCPRCPKSVPRGTDPHSSPPHCPLESCASLPSELQLGSPRRTESSGLKSCLAPPPFGPL